MGLLPPVYDNGSLLVDGGYINNLPLDVMRDLAPQLSEIVAVDVENKDNSAFENVSDYGDSLSVRYAVPVPISLSRFTRYSCLVAPVQGWWLLRQMILSMFRLAKPIKIPGQYDVALTLSYISHAINIRELLKQGLVHVSEGSIVYWCTVLLSSGVSQEDKSIVYIRPEVQAYRLMEYHKFDEIVSKGRDAALKKLKVRFRCCR